MPDIMATPATATPNIDKILVTEMAGFCEGIVSSSLTCAANYKQRMSINKYKVQIQPVNFKYATRKATNFFFQMLCNVQEEA